MNRPSSRMRTLALVLGCFLAVFGARAAYVGAFGTDLPTWDQWDAEGEYLFLPYEQGRLRLADLFQPHNEHRIVPTKLVALALLIANGQWDGRLECVTNAALVALTAAGILAFGLQLLDRRWHPAWLVAVLACFAAPLSWQNVVGGFHTVQTFIVSFSLLGVALLVDSRALTVRWWAGLAFALVAVVTLGSGLLAAGAAAASLVVLTPWRELPRRHALTFVACGAVAGLGLATRVTVAHHDALMAASVQDFLLCFWRSLQWPVVGVSLYPLLGWLPWTVLTWQAWRAGDRAPRGDRVLVAAGVWVLAQYAASAYARGAGGSWPADRYYDTIGVGLLVNLLALLVLCSRPARSLTMRRARIALALPGLALLAHGWAVHIDEVVFTTGPQISVRHSDREGNTRAFVRTGDPAHLIEDRIPYPSASTLLARMSHPEILALLPVSVRKPLALSGTSLPTDGFTVDATSPDHPAPHGWSTIGSFGPQREVGEAEWRSDPIPATKSGYWAIPIFASHHEPATLSASLEDATGRTEAVSLHRVRRMRLPGSDWHVAVVPAPRADARLVVRDRSALGWIAFGAPVELATGSYLAWRVAGHGLPIFGVGMMLSTAALLGIFSTRTAAAEPCVRAWRRLRAMPPLLAWTSALSSGVLAAWGAAGLLHRIEPAYFEARVSGDLNKRSMELFHNLGRGIRGEESVQVWFEERETTRELRLRMHPGRIQALRIDPMDHGATLRIENARIVDRDGEVLRELPPSLFQPRAQIASITRVGNSTTVTSEPGALDSQLAVALDPPVFTRPLGWRGWKRHLVLGLAAAAGALLGTTLADTFRVACVRARELRHRARGTS